MRNPRRDRSSDPNPYPPSPQETSLASSLIDAVEIELAKRWSVTEIGREAADLIQSFGVRDPVALFGTLQDLGRALSPHLHDSPHALNPRLHPSIRSAVFFYSRLASGASPRDAAFLAVRLAASAFWLSHISSHPEPTPPRV